MNISNLIEFVTPCFVSNCLVNMSKDSVADAFANIKDLISLRIN